MTAVRSGRPGLLVLLVLLAALAGSCCSMRSKSMDVATLNRIAQPSSNPCRTNGNPPINTNFPIICVHDEDLDHLSVWPPNARAYRSVLVLWWTTSGTSTLSMDFKGGNGSPVGYIACLSAQGHCRAAVSPAAAGSYSYSATVTRNGKVGTIDPTIIIDTN
ncbi:MAG: hypothetical protein ACXV5L_12115 [Thermoanaerobaculia bacterium]